MSEVSGRRQQRPCLSRFRVCGALAAIVLVAFLAWGAVWIVRRLQSTALANARHDLRQLALERTAAARTTLVRHAAQELDKTGPLGRTPGVTLLRYVTRVLSSLDGSVPTFPHELDVAAVSTDDLLLAAESFLGVRQLGLAEPLAKAAYGRQEQRQRVLQLMTSVEYELGADELVLACCREWEQLDSGTAIPWLITVFVYENRGKLQLVIEPLRQAIERLPPPAGVYRTQLVEYLLQLRQIAAARQEYDALRSIADLPAISLTEARLLFAEGETQRALEMAQSLIASAPDDPAVMALVGKILLAQNDPAAALPTLSALVERFPFEPEAHYLVGQALARLKRGEESRLHLNRHQALVRAKTEIHKLQRQASREPDNWEIRRELVRQCDEVQWTERAAFWRDAAEAVRSSREVTPLKR